MPFTLLAHVVPPSSVLNTPKLTPATKVPAHILLELLGSIVREKIGTESLVEPSLVSIPELLLNHVAPAFVLLLTPL